MHCNPSAMVAFDIDGCLMPVNSPAHESTRRQLLRIAGSGARIVFASGKPCAYLSGLARGLGVVDCSLIGENGADIWINSAMPPQRISPELSGDEISALHALKDEVLAIFGERVFLQPNLVGVTAFPVADDLTPQEICDAVEIRLPETIAKYVHVDSVDWAVRRLDKGAALRQLAQHLGVALSRTVAVGDGANDLPMMEVTGLAIWLGPPDWVADIPAKCVSSIHEALELVFQFLRGELLD